MGAQMGASISATSTTWALVVKMSTASVGSCGALRLRQAQDRANYEDTYIMRAALHHSVLLLPSCAAACISKLIKNTS